MIIPSFVLDFFGGDYVNIVNDEVIYKCPYCIDEVGKEDKRGHLYVNMKNGFYFCHRCGSRGSVNTDEENAITVENSYLVVDVLKKRVKNENVVDENIMYYIPSSYPYTNSELAYNYLVDRGITEDLQKFYDIRVGDLYGDMFGRVLIPNKVIKHNYTDMFVGRTYIGGKKKYKNPLHSNKSKIVFNLHRIEKRKPIIITEGVFSAMSAGKDAVALYGKTISDYQFKLILNHEPKIIFVSLDSDAKRESIDLCNKICDNSSIEVRLVNLPEGQDPSDLGTEKFLNYLHNSAVYNRLNALFNNLYGGD